MAHTYYTMSEYEQQLVTAGWVDAGSLDADYQEYRRGFAYPELEDAFLEYHQWVATKREWDKLDAEYESKYGHLPSDDYDRYRGDADTLLKRMGECEFLLGY